MVIDLKINRDGRGLHCDHDAFVSGSNKAWTCIVTFRESRPSLAFWKLRPGCIGRVGNSKILSQNFRDAQLHGHSRSKLAKVTWESSLRLGNRSPPQEEHLIFSLPNSFCLEPLHSVRSSMRTLHTPESEPLDQIRTSPCSFLLCQEKCNPKASFFPLLVLG